MSDDLVSTEWLAAHLGSPDIAIIDASWHLPAARRGARAEFLEARIPGAQFFDIDEIADTENPLPHTLPCAGEILLGCAQTRHRRWQEGHRL